MDSFQVEKISDFELRKRDHLELSLKDKNEAKGLSGLEKIQLLHDALPELNFQDVTLKTKILNWQCSTPFLISSMTAGHNQGEAINLKLAKVAAKKKWLMGIGSQRRQLFDDSAVLEWRRLREQVPDVELLGNLGLSQLIKTPIEKVKSLVESLNAKALIIHTNPLQECLQTEGTPDFKGGIAALKALSTSLEIPIILKEVGCGFSKESFLKLNHTGIAAVDVAGLGGTHWGRVEGDRAVGKKASVANTFANWGIPTVDAVSVAQSLKLTYSIWASGGVRTGLDAAKLLALGAHAVGFAKPALQKAQEGEKALEEWMSTIEYELKVALFCTGSKTCQDIRGKYK